MAQDDYYYEIQLTNKQLVFYFMAGASGLILSFLAGIMVGRGVDASAEVQAAAPRPVIEDRIITEEPPATAAKPAATVSEELSYSRVLEADKPTDTAPSVVAESRPAKGAVTVPVTTLPSATATTRKPQASPAGAPAASTTLPVERPAALASAPAPVPASTGAVTFQVGAFKEKAYADQQVGSLKKKGYAAYVVSPDGAGSLYNVRVGPYGSPDSAERAKKQLIAEKLSPFPVKQ